MPSDSSVDALLFALFEAPASDWPRRLDELCAERPEHAGELRRRHALLAATGLDREVPAIGAAGLPERLGEFRLLRQLGTGGMGMVFVARQESLGRDVALKVVRPDLVFSADAQARFRREIEAVAQLEHPAIVPVLTHDRHGDVPFYVMPLVPGRSCDAVIQRLLDRGPGSLSGHDLRRAIQDDAPESDPTGTFTGAYWQACVRLVRQAALGLDHAHRRGIVHRDVKPSNVLLTPDGRALLLDFGLAHVRDDARITRTGATPGSPAYMAPEQVRGLSADERSDVYSLAATLQHLLTLAPPFPIDDPVQLRARILTGRRQPIAPRCAPRELAIVIAAAMDIAPERRHAIALAFADDLGAVLGHRPILARPLPASLRLRRWTQRHPTATTAIGALLTMVFGVPVLLAIGIAGERDRARDAETLASRHAYEASIAAAGAALRNGDVREAERRLAACPEALRGFEWRHLQLATDAAIFDLASGGVAATALGSRPDGATVAVGDANGNVVLWPGDASHAPVPLTLPAAGTVRELEWNRTGERLVVLRDLDGGQEITVVDTGSRTVVAHRTTTRDQSVCLAAQADCILVCEDATVRVLDPRTTDLQRTVHLQDLGTPPLPPFASDGTWLFAATNGSVRAWSLADGSGEALRDQIQGTVADATAANGRAAFATDTGVFLAETAPLRLRHVDTGTRPCTDVVMDARGTFAVGIGRDATVRTWDVRTSAIVAQSAGLRGEGRAVALATDRMTVVVNDDSGALRGFGLFGGSERQLLHGHSGIVSQIAIAPNGEILSASHEPSLRSWDPATGGPLTAKYPDSHWVNAMLVAARDDLVHVAASGLLTTRRLPRLEEVAQIDLGSVIRYILPLPADRLLVVLTDRIVMHDVPTATPRILAEHRQPTTACATAPAARRAFLASAGHIERWSLDEAPRTEHTFPVEGRVTALATDAAGELLWCAEGTRLRCRTGTDGAIAWERNCARAVTTLWHFADGTRLAAGHEDGSISLFEPTDGRPLSVLQAGRGPIRSLLAPPTGDWLAAGDAEGVVTLFRAPRETPSTALRTTRALVGAATRLDDEMRREFTLQSRVLAAVERRDDLAPALRDAMLHSERLRPPWNWEGAAELFTGTLTPDEAPAFYRHALDVAEATLADDRLGFSRSIAAYASLRLGRFADALQHSDAAIAQHAGQPTFTTMARACRVMALARLGRRDEATAELAVLRAGMDERPGTEEIAVVREAEREVRR